MRIMLAAVMVVALCTIVPISVSAQEGSISGVTSFEVEVGSAEAAQLISEMAKEYPYLLNEIDGLRIAMAGLEMGSTMKVELEVYRGEVSAINWNEVLAVTGTGILLAAAWQLFGMEALCFVGIAPACVCVGPQC